MKIALVQAPVFDHRTPSNALALLRSLLAREGIASFVHDASKCVWKRFSAELGDEFRDARTFMPVLDRHSRLTARFLDEEAGHILEEKPVLVGFSVLARTEQYSLALAERIKRRAPSVKVVFGGAQCLRENMAREFAEHPAVDAVALAEADLSFPAFLKKWGGHGELPVAPGMLVKTKDGVVDGGDGPVIEKLDGLPYLDFSPFALDDYSGDVLYLSTTRGCVRKCSFCTHIVGQKTFRTMSAARTVDEIRHQIAVHPDRSVIEFTDSLVNGDVRRLGEIADLLTEYRVERLAGGRQKKDFGWIGMAIIHPTMSPALLKRLRRSGCVQLRFGLESASQKVLDSMQKRYNISDGETVIKNAKRAGISVYLYVLVGFPTEGEKEFQETLDFIERNAESIDQVGVSNCEIQKGSHMDLHPELYGIRRPLSDRLRWVTEDGANDYAVRQERMKRMQKLLAGLKLGEFEFPTRLGATLKSEPEYDFYKAHAETAR